MKILTVQGYYDGENIRLLENIPVKPNQKVMITIMDEFVEPAQRTQVENLRGILSEYANPALVGQEKEAWERAANEKYGHF